MGYLIKKTNFKKRAWKVQYQSYKGGSRKITDIPEHNYLTLGFRPDMTIDEARSRRDSLNAQEHLARHEERRNEIHTRIKEENVVHTAFLGESFVKEFEAEIINRRPDKKSNKSSSHWQTTKHVIVSLKLDPTIWYKRPEKFYDYFSAQQWSLSYVQKILRMLNLWGDWVTDKLGQRFKPIPAPRRQERDDIEKAYYDKRPNGMASRPITFQEIESAKSKLKPQHYNWLYLAIWLGLRPKEVDRLKTPTGPWTWHVKGNVLWVFQPKLYGPREEKLKPIPLLRPEQKRAIQIILSGEFDRPLTKTLKSYFGPQTFLYCGRKAFTDMMLELGYKLEDISVWMGHRSIERTWKSYKNKQKSYGT